MIKTDFVDVLTMIVEHELELYANNKTLPNAMINYDNSVTKPGIIIPITITAIHPNSEEICTDAVFVFCGNVSVFFSDSVFEYGLLLPFREMKPYHWENTSNHDSCWKSDGLRNISEICFQLCSLLDDSIPPKDIEVTASFSYPVKVWTTLKPKEDYGFDLIKVERRN